MKVQFILGVLFLLIFSGCNTNNNHPVPSVPFDLSIDLTLPTYDDLLGVGGYAFVNAGSRGVIVYRRGVDDFVAFDRHSPADINGTCAQPLTPDPNNFLALQDTCNNAQFSLFDGSPMNGSEFGLRQYGTSWGGGTVLRIFNN